MMALRREKESFHVRPEPLQKLVERLFVPRTGNSLLFRQDLLGVPEIVNVTMALQDEIKAMGRESTWREKFRDRVETGRQRIWRNVFENRDGKNRVE